MWAADSRGVTFLRSLLRPPPAPALQPKAESISPDDIVRESEQSRRSITVQVTAVTEVEPTIRPADLDMQGPLVAQIRALLPHA